MSASQIEIGIAFGIFMDTSVGAYDTLEEANAKAEEFEELYAKMDGKQAREFKEKCRKWTATRG